MTYSVLILRKPGTETAFAGFIFRGAFVFLFACRRANTDRPRADGKSFEAVPAESSRLS